MTVHAQLQLDAQKQLDNEDWWHQGSVLKWYSLSTSLTHLTCRGQSWWANWNLWVISHHGDHKSCYKTYQPACSNDSLRKEGSPCHHHVNIFKTSFVCWHTAKQPAVCGMTKWADIYFGQPGLSKQVRWSPKSSSLDAFIGGQINYFWPGHSWIHPSAMWGSNVESAPHKDMQKLG